MIYKLTITILLFNICLFSQQASLFKNPPGNLTLPSVLTEENGTPKTSGLGSIESKWIQSTSSNAESLLQTFSSSADIGINQMIKDIMIKANIPDSKISQIKINFSSYGVEEWSIDKDAVIFSEDFSVKYPGENMLLITKLYRTKNAKIELTDGSSSDFDPAVKDAFSEGLRFGNKSETILGNTMVIEILSLMYAYEYVPMNISRLIDRNLVLPLYQTTDIALNSITNMSVGEGAQQYDYLVNVGSDVSAKPIEFRISNVDPKVNFRVGGREGYTLTYIESGGNKVTFSISGFSVSFP